jgi:hypothetical protein
MREKNLNEAAAAVALAVLLWKQLISTSAQQDVELLLLRLKVYKFHLN